MAQTKPKAAQFYGVSDNGTDGQFLKTDGTGGMSWDSPITNPTITSIDYPGTQTAADPAGGESVIINGTLFASGITCTVGGTSAVTAFNSATQITITTPAKAAGQYTVAVTNPDGGTVSQANFIQYSGVPVWSTATGNIGSVQSGSTASFQVTATEGSDTIEYAVTTGTLPTGLSLATATGAITGTAGAVSADTTTTFSITATDDENQTSSARSFNITVTPDLPSNHFTPVIWSGNGSSARSISTGFEADMIWIKSRNYTNNHFLIDSIRGKDGGTTYENLYPNLNSGQANDSGITAIGSTSFTTGNARFASNDWVAWAWKAGGAAVANTNGTIASQVSVNNTLGFSIVSFVPNGAASVVSTGHGLSVQPEMVIFKNTAASSYWFVYHKDIGNNGYLSLNESFGTQNYTPFFDMTATTIAIRQSSLATSGQASIAYAFTSKTGFSKVGSYTGNGSTSGPIVNTGFEPAFLMIKRSDSSANWRMLDNKRSTTNPRNKELYPNLSNSEGTFSAVNFYANGFQNISTDASYNANGGTYIYLAFAADGSTTTPSLANSFDTETYTGNAGTKTITTSFAPDLTWIKTRNAANNHQLYDSVRGATARLYPNLTNAVAADPNGLTSFNNNGFTLGNSSNVNSTGTFVSWNWKAGGLASINTDGSITSLVSANQAAGFSIVNYTGNQSNATIGHGLSSAPEMIIAKSTTVAQNWAVYHKDAGNQYWLRLNGINARQLEAIWQNTTPSATTFSVNGNVVINASSSTNIAYCLHSVAGYSKVGSYVGTGVLNTIATGFEPSWVLIKKTNDTGGWLIFDNKRNTSNPRNSRIEADNSQAEQTGSTSKFVNFNSTNLQIGGNNGELNASGDTYIYLAIKEN